MEIKKFLLYTPLAAPSGIAFSLASVGTGRKLAGGTEVYKGFGIWNLDGNCFRDWMVDLEEKKNEIMLPPIKLTYGIVGFS